MQSSNCDNAKIIRTVFFDLDITKTNKQLIDQLKKDTLFTNYEKQKQELAGADMTVTFANFNFSKHPLIKKNGRIKIQESPVDGGIHIVYYFGFDKEAEAKQAFFVLTSELNKGCFEKKVWYEGSVQYKSNNVSINLVCKNFGPQTSLSVLLDKE